jgi:hypothetical protein
MLFSSGDYPGTLSSILSGEGLDEGEQGSIAVIVFGGTFLRLGPPAGSLNFFTLAVTRGCLSLT